MARNLNTKRMDLWVPAHLYDRIAASSQEHRRSLTQEVILRLEADSRVRDTISTYTEEFPILDGLPKITYPIRKEKLHE